MEHGRVSRSGSAIFLPLLTVRFIIVDRNTLRLRSRGQYAASPATAIVGRFPPVRIQPSIKGRAPPATFSVSTRLLLLTGGGSCPKILRVILAPVCRGRFGRPDGSAPLSHPIMEHELIDRAEAIQRRILQLRDSL